MEEKNMQKIIKYLNDSFAYLKQNKKELAEMTLHYAITEKSNYSTQEELNRFKECLMNYARAIDQNPILKEWEFAKTLRQRIINSSNKNNSTTRKNQASKLREYMKEQKEHLDLTPYEIIPLKIKAAKQPSQLEKTLSEIRSQEPTSNPLKWNKNAINAFKSAKKDF